MSEQRCRVIQWATGSVGKAALRHFVESPAFELVGVLVYDAAKVGKDAGELAGCAPTGVSATDNQEAVIALDADCVFYTPIWPDVDTICRLLLSGKNVVAVAGVYFPTKFTQADADKIAQACREGGTSFHASGIHPGYAGDLLPLTLARLASRIDQVQVYEVVNFGEYPSKYIALMGFGLDPQTFTSGPSLLASSVPYFEQSMAMIAEGLGGTIDEVTSEVQIATATKDFEYAGNPDSDLADLRGVVPAGTVAAQHHTWTAWVDGAPLIQFHAQYTMGDDVVDGAEWAWGSNKYRVVIQGDPPTELTLQGSADEHGHVSHPGYTWTAMAAVNAIHAVCAAEAGLLTHLDLSALRLPGLTRPVSAATPSSAS